MVDENLDHPENSDSPNNKRKEVPSEVKSERPPKFAKIVWDLDNGTSSSKQSENSIESRKKRFLTSNKNSTTSNGSNGQIFGSISTTQLRIQNQSQNQQRFLTQNQIYPQYNGFQQFQTGFQQPYPQMNQFGQIPLKHVNGAMFMQPQQGNRFNQFQTQNEMMPNQRIARPLSNSLPTNSTNESQQIPAPANGNPALKAPEQNQQATCRFWPNCHKQGCEFFHPATQQTAAMQNLECRYGAQCTRPDCKFSHPSPAATAAKKASIMSKVRCRFWPNCINPNCGFMHPTGNALTESGTAVGESGVTSLEETHKLLAKIECKYEPFCNRPGCPYMHSGKQAPHISER
ncbi:hypothetical protein HK096_005411, partial [Nowakowskiella sp. JEL0078]